MSVGRLSFDRGLELACSTGGGRSGNRLVQFLGARWCGSDGAGGVLSVCVRKNTYLPAPKREEGVGAEGLVRSIGSHDGDANEGHGATRPLLRVPCNNGRKGGGGTQNAAYRLSQVGSDTEFRIGQPLKVVAG